MKQVQGLMGAAALAMLASTGTADTEAFVAQGEEVFGRVCLECHGATKQGPDMLAPPIFAAKNHYSSYTEQEAFVAAVSAFVIDPKADSAMMPGAVSKFGLMPKPEITAEEAAAVAHYLWATDFSTPDWYEEHYKAEHGAAPAN